MPAQPHTAGSGNLKFRTEVPYIIIIYYYMQFKFENLITF